MVTVRTTATCRPSWSHCRCRAAVTDIQHQPVLADEVMAGLQVREDGKYVDATYGRGGHSRRILRALGEHGRLLVMDRDPAAIAAAREEWSQDPRVIITKGPFSMLGQAVAEQNWTGRVDGVLLDLGVSSPQLDEAGRGFSFRQHGPLDMRMDTESGQTAADWLAQADEAELTHIIKVYGEERFARRIARAIVAEREQSPIETTERLAAIVSAAVPTREPGKDPATRTFQAIRIHINRELEELDVVLPQTIRILAPGGRLAVISFHSLEDRRVKRFIRDASKGDPFPIDLPVTSDQLTPALRTIGKAVKPGQAELGRNPRARSAVLRVAERTEVAHG